MLRSRLTSFLLLLASPAVGGTVLPVAHPCPVDSPWQAGEAGDAHRGHGSQDDRSQAPADRTEHTCTCPGTCAAGVAVVVPTAVDGQNVPDVALRLVRSIRSTPIDWSHSLLDLLPPSTAPPIA